MKITAFILSILLSTAALAENRAEQYSDVNMTELREQIRRAVEDGKVTVVEGVDEAVEAIKEKFDRGDITEEQKNDLIRSIYSIEAARATAPPISGLSALSQHAEAGEGECKCPSSFAGSRMSPMSYGIIAGLMVGVVYAALLMPMSINYGPLLIFPVGGAVIGGVVGVVVGGVVEALVELIRGDCDTSDDACAQICSLANQAQQ